MNPPLDPGIDDHITHMVAAARSLELDLSKLRYYLSTKPGAEMSPGQAQRLVDLLNPLGLIAFEIVHRDLERTSRRESGRPEYDA